MRLWNENNRQGHYLILRRFVFEERKILVRTISQQAEMRLLEGEKLLNKWPKVW